MTPLHEIGFVVLTGLFQCWFYPAAQNPCPEGDKLSLEAYETPDLKAKPQLELTRSEALTQFETREAGYEEYGFAVYEKRADDWYQVRKKNGRSYWLRLPQRNQRNDDTAIARTPLWTYKPLEDILGSALLHAWPNYDKDMRKADLETIDPLPQSAREKVSDRHLKQLLKRAGAELPQGLLEITVPCTTREISRGNRRGSCEALPKTAVYAKPDKKAERRWDMTLSWANIEGFDSITPEKNLQTLYVFEEVGDWARIRLVVGPKDKRIGWINIKDLDPIATHLRPIGKKDQLAALKVLLKKAGSPYADSFDELNELPAIEPTGKTKWSADGRLWLEVRLRDIESCSPEEAETLMTTWLPYKASGAESKSIDWSPRGC